VVVGEAVGGGAVGGGCEGLAEFGVIPGGGVDEPAEAVGVGVEIQGAVVAELGDLGFGELACGEIFRSRWCG
jgi:hypothetical protein